MYTGLSLPLFYYYLVILPSSSAMRLGELDAMVAAGLLAGGGEQGGVLESSGSTRGDPEDRDEGPEVGQHSARGSAPSNCLETN